MVPHYCVKLQDRPIVSICSRELLEHQISNGKAGLSFLSCLLELILNLNSRERRRAATPIANRTRGESFGSRSRDGDRRNT